MMAIFNLAVRVFSTLLWVVFGMSVIMVNNYEIPVGFSLWLLLFAFIVELWS